MRERLDTRFSSLQCVGPPQPVDSFCSQASHFLLHWKDSDPPAMGSEIQKAGGVPKGHWHALKQNKGEHIKSEIRD